MLLSLLYKQSLPPTAQNLTYCRVNKGIITDFFFPLTNSRKRKKEKQLKIPSPSHPDYSHAFFGRALPMISRGFASWGTCQEKIYISQGWVWVKVRRKLQDRAEVWVQAKKRELKVKRRVHVLTGGRHGVKNLRTGLRVQGICDIHRERKEKDKLKRKKNGTYLSGIWSWLFYVKRTDGIKEPREKYRSFNITFVLQTVTHWTQVHC